MYRERIAELKTEMAEVLVKYGRVNPQRFDRVFVNADTITDQQAEILWNWLVAFRGSEYAELYRIYRLPLDNSNDGPELWDRYFKLGKTNLREMKMMRKQGKICRDKWREAPLFKLSKKEKSNEAETKDHEDAAVQPPV